MNTDDPIYEPLFRLKRALEDGISKDEWVELIAHLAFYSGWPTANTALPIALCVIEAAGA